MLPRHWRREFTPVLTDKLLGQSWCNIIRLTRLTWNRILHLRGTLPNDSGLCCRLSGESPFQGGSDAETFALVTAAHYTFDEESFEDISDQAKDFISSLLKKDRRFDCFFLDFYFLLRENRKK